MPKEKSLIFSESSDVVVSQVIVGGEKLEWPMFSLVILMNSIRYKKKKTLKPLLLEH